jgi:hypothetical protein
MPDFGIFRGFNDKLFGDKLYAGQLPTQLGIIGSEIVTDFLLLDFYPNAAAAYSLRKLRKDYTGSAIEVRRTNNDVADIGFTGLGELDTTALLAFTGTGALDNGFVTKWYDQSGNGRNATQATALNQPQIVSSGSVILENNKPTLQFNGSGGYQILNRPLTGASAFSVFSTFNIKTAQSFEMIFTQSDGTANNGRFEIRRNSTSNRLEYIGNDSTASTMVGTLDINNKQILSSYIGSINVATAHINNVLDKTSTNTQINIGDFEAAIGQRITPVGVQFPLNGVFQELVIYASEQSSNRTAIETNINDFYSIY